MFKKKNLNIIIYKRGYCGKFLQFILSLYEKTYPIFQNNISISNDIDRKQIYSYSNIGSNFYSWKNFHDSFANEEYDVDLSRIKNFLVHKSYDYYTASFHPYEYWTAHKSELDKPYVNLKYVLIDLKPEYNFIIENFRKENEGWPELYPEDEEVYEIIKSQTSPYILQLHNFFNNMDTFISEYEKVCWFLELPPMNNDALYIWKDWYRLRGLGKYSKDLFI